MEKIEKLKDCKLWINERLQYIAENCDLNNKDNKRAFENLKIALKCVEKMEVQKMENLKNKMIIEKKSEHRTFYKFTEKNKKG